MLEKRVAYSMIDIWQMLLANLIGLPGGGRDERDYKCLTSRWNCHGTSEA